MNKNCAVATSVSALAEIIALKLSDEELALIAAILVQLGDTLATILTLRECGGKG
jgi:dolichol kinase